MNIKFSPPDIGELEIQYVVEALKSGWITTGPKTKLFEKKIAEYCKTNRAVCLNSATAGLELVLRILGVGEGDEVITPAYTYTASASVIDHVGAKIVLCDIQQNSLEMDYAQLERLITPKTKVIIPVDIAGKMCDYNKIFEIVENKRDIFSPSGELQSRIGRITVLSDAAHSFGAYQTVLDNGINSVYTHNKMMSGSVADFTSFSFHAVKNLTTAEGGAVTWANRLGLDDEYLYKQFMLWSLHGQNKDALAKTQVGSWEYDIQILGQKCNMTDVVAGIGLAQLERYDSILNRRREIITRYDRALAGKYVSVIDHYNGGVSCGHLYITRVPNVAMEQRNAIIIKMAEMGIATNVHYKPLPMHTAYINKGFNIKDFPNAHNAYVNAITLPLHTLLTDEEIEYVINSYIACISEVKYGK